jgi:hypothetical protein
VAAGSRGADGPQRADALPARQVRSLAGCRPARAWSRARPAVRSLAGRRAPRARDARAGSWFSAAGRTAGLIALVALSLAGRAQAHAADGFTLEAVLPSAAYVVPGAPSVVVHTANNFDPRAPLHLVVFLHGYNGCARVLMSPGSLPCRAGAPEEPGWDLAAAHDAAGVNSIFIIPQLAFRRRDGRPGAFERPAVFRAFLEELLAGPLAARLGPHRIADIAGIDLVAHSAGYQTALAILEHGGVADRIKSVVLLDALYGETPRFAHYVETHIAAGLRFVSISIGHGATERENRALYEQLRRSFGDRVGNADAASLVASIANHPIVIGTGTPPHRLVPTHHLAEILRALHSARP